MRTARLAPPLLLLFFAGCPSEKEHAPDLSRATAPAAVPAPAPAATPPPVPLPEKAEVELTGHFEAPKGAKGEPRLWVTDGPCFQAGSHAVGETRPNAGGFFVEVFVPQGTNLWICGALVTPGATQATVYGSSPRPVLARGAGEVAVPNIPVVLKQGPPVALPAR